MGARVYNGLGYAMGALVRVPVARWVLCVPRRCHWIPARGHNSKDDSPHDQHRIYGQSN